MGSISQSQRAGQDCLCCIHFLFLFLMNVSPIECSCFSGRILASLRMESTIVRFIETFMVDEMNAKLEVETWLFFFWFLKSCHFGATHNTPRVNIPKYLHLSLVVSEKLKLTYIH